MLYSSTAISAETNISIHSLKGEEDVRWNYSDLTDERSCLSSRRGCSELEVAMAVSDDGTGLVREMILHADGRCCSDLDRGIGRCELWWHLDVQSSIVQVNAQHSML